MSHLRRQTFNLRLKYPLQHETLLSTLPFKYQKLARSCLYIGVKKNILQPLSTGPSNPGAKAEKLQIKAGNLAV